MLGFLLKQVAGRSREIPEKIVQAFKDQKRFLGGQELQLSQILELLEVTSSLQRTFLCIDALDEFVAVHRLKILNSLRQVLQKSPRTRLFLTRRAHIEVRSKVVLRVESDGSTPLSNATLSGHEGVVELLLAQEDVNPDRLDNNGRGPILIAAMMGRVG